VIKRAFINGDWMGENKALDINKKALKSLIARLL
jgi:hypothetical protein